MSETKHTPGPWAVHEHAHADGEFWCSIGREDGFGPIADIVGAEGNHAATFQPVAGMKYLVTPVEEQRANARLIAAAPALLEELREARKLLVIEGYYTDEDPQPDGVGRLIDAAIAAATGGEREG